jgi:hypothetical protein
MRFDGAGLRNDDATRDGAVEKMTRPPSMKGSHKGEMSNRTLRLYSYSERRNASLSLGYGLTVDLLSRDIYGDEHFVCAAETADLSVREFHSTST